MSIVSSAFALGPAQRDGRCYVTETHETDSGEPVVVEYGPVDSKLNLQAIAEARAIVIDAETAQRSQDKSERKLAEKAVAAVFAEAVQANKLTPEDLKRAGVDSVVAAAKEPALAEAAEALRG